MNDSPSSTQPPIATWQILCYIVAILLVLCIIPEEIVSSAVHFLFGWLIYIYRTLPLLTFSLDGIVTGLVLIVLTTGGLFSWLGDRSTATTPDATPAIRTMRQRLWLSLRATIALVVLFVSGLCLIGIVHQTGWLWNYSGPFFHSSVGAAARRSQSQDQLHNLVISVHNYTEVHNQIAPMGGAFNEQGVGQHGWITYMLPYVEEKALYDRIDFDRPWNDPVNQQAMSEEVFILQNPAYWNEPTQSPGTPYGPTHYVGNEHLLGPNWSFRMDQIPDGISNTIFSGEIVSRIPPWGSPMNYRDPSLGIGRHPNGFGSSWANGSCQFGMLDGKVITVNPKIDPTVLKALSTPNGSDNPGDQW